MDIVLAVAGVLILVLGLVLLAAGAVGYCIARTDPRDNGDIE